MLQFLQRIGKALMLPIAVLPAAGIVLRLGSADMLDIPLMVAAGGAIFDNLPLIFAIGVAIGLSIDASGAAGLAGAIGYLKKWRRLDEQGLFQCTDSSKI